MRLRDIRRALRAGVHPRDLDGARYLGSGAQRTTYLVGDYVIKQSTPPYSLDNEAQDNYGDDPEIIKRDGPLTIFPVPRKQLKRIGVEPPQQWYAGRWVIQPYYIPLTGHTRQHWTDYTSTRSFFWRTPRACSHPERRVRLDIHPNNMGINPRTGRIHAFDW